MHCYFVYTITPTNRSELSLAKIGEYCNDSADGLVLSTAFFDPIAEYGDTPLEAAKCEIKDGSLLIFEGEFNYDYNGKLNLRRFVAALGFSVEVHQLFIMSTDGDLFDGGEYFTLRPNGEIEGWCHRRFDPQQNKWVETVDEKTAVI